MRFSVIAVTLLGATASAIAQSTSGYPACANPCLVNPNLGGCVATNLPCLCANQVFVSNTTSCISSACTGADLQSALKTAREICAKVGVTLTAAGSTPTGSVKSSGSATTYSALLGLGAAAVAAIYL